MVEQKIGYTLEGTPELNPVMTNVFFSLEGIDCEAYFLQNKIKNDNQILTEICEEFEMDAGDLFVEARNDGDEIITVRAIIKIDDSVVFNKIHPSLNPGAKTSYELWSDLGPHEEWITPGTHNIAWELYAQAGESIGPSALLYETGNVDYMLPLDDVIITFVTRKEDGTELKGVSVYLNGIKKGET